MKLSLILVALLAFGNLPLKGELGTYPAGEVPPLTLARAVSICELVASKSILKKFSPYSASLYGDSKKGAGAWHFYQLAEKGGSYQISVIFPDEICIIRDEREAPVEAFNSKGERLDLPPAYKELKEVIDKYSKKEKEGKQ